MRCPLGLFFCKTRGSRASRPSGSPAGARIASRRSAICVRLPGTANQQPQTAVRHAGLTEPIKAPPQSGEAFLQDPQAEPRAKRVSRSIRSRWCGVVGAWFETVASRPPHHEGAEAVAGGSAIRGPSVSNTALCVPREEHRASCAAPMPLMVRSERSSRLEPRASEQAPRTFLASFTRSPWAPLPLRQSHAAAIKSGRIPIKSGRIPKGP